MGHIQTCCRMEMKVIQSIQSISNPAVVQLHIKDQVVPMEIDTGACVSVMGFKEFKSKFPKIKVLKYVNNLVSVSDQELEVYGSSQLRVSF